MITIGEKNGERAGILKCIAEKRAAQAKLEEEILEKEKELRKREKFAYKIKIFPCTYYLPAEDATIWKGENYKFYHLDLSSYYEGRYLLGENIIKITEDVRSRIQIILTENKGLEDWSVLGALLLRTYNSQNED